MNASERQRLTWVPRDPPLWGDTSPGMHTLELVLDYGGANLSQGVIELYYCDYEGAGLPCSCGYETRTLVPFRFLTFHCMCGGDNLQDPLQAQVCTQIRMGIYPRGVGQYLGAPARKIDEACFVAQWCGVLRSSAATGTQLGGVSR